MRKVEFTKKGWFFLCPIYSTDRGEIIARQNWYWWWLSFNKFLFFPIKLLVGGEFVCITAELDKKIVANVM